MRKKEEKRESESSTETREKKEEGGIKRAVQEQSQIEWRVSQERERGGGREEGGGRREELRARYRSSAKEQDKNIREKEEEEGMEGREREYKERYMYIQEQS